MASKSTHCNRDDHFSQKKLIKPMNFPEPGSTDGKICLNGKTRRPPNAYILFCLEKRSELRTQHPHLPNVDISKLLGDKWKELGESERLPYKERAKTLQAEFKEQNPGYRYEKARQKRTSQTGFRQQNKQLGIESAALLLYRLVSAAGLNLVSVSDPPRPQSPQEPFFAGELIDTDFDH